MINLHTDIDIRTLPIEDAHKKIDGINQVAEHFYSIKNLEGSKYCTENALEMSEAVNYVKGLGEAKCNLAMLNYKGDDNVSCIQNLLESEKLFKSTEDVNNLAKVSYKLGYTYWQIGDYGSEIEYFFKALALYRQIGSLKEEADCLNSIGNYYVETQDYESSLEYHRMSLDIKKKNKNVRGVIFSLYNMALINNNIAAFTISDQRSEPAVMHFNKALKLYTAAMEFNDKFEKDLFLEKRILQNMALIHSNFDEFEKSLEMLLGCGDYFTKTCNDEDQCDTLIYLGVIYTRMKDWDKAEKTFLEAIEIAKRLHSNRHFINLYQNFSHMYIKLEDYKSALFYIRKYFELERERIKTLMDNNLRNLNVLHKVDITKKETEVLSERNDKLRMKNLELIKLNKEKNYFLNLAANDLRLPLERINNTINKVRNTDRDVKAKNLSEILEESSNMQKIISELLSVNEMDTVQ